MSFINWLYRRVGKRLLDIGLACVGLVGMALPMAAIALWIAWESKSSPFFRQIRIGRSGLPFRIMKLKTMSSDQRVSSFGKGLRATAMDELPQLFQILAGQMSFVGPRPIVPEELAQLDQFPDGRRRLAARPGLTGLAQICGPKTPALAERLRWDLEYVDRCGLSLDLGILLKSVEISCRGAWGK